MDNLFFMLFHAEEKTRTLGKKLLRNVKVKELFIYASTLKRCRWRIQHNGYNYVRFKISDSCKEIHIQKSPTETVVVNQNNFETIDVDLALAYDTLNK